MDTTGEKRGHPRQAVFTAVMVTPNGDRHNAEVFDLSLGGAHVGLSGDWTPACGTTLRMTFLDGTDDVVVLQGRVARVAVDHLGLEFAPAQEDRIRQLLDAIISGKAADAPNA